jgi:type II secretory pathway pseudopilin PulG
MNLRGQANSRRACEQGYAMAALLVAMTIMAVMLTVAMPVWKQMTQREKEEELIFRGTQYAHAIGLFQRKYANAYPPNVDVLVNERFLRKKFKDPITNDDFVPIAAAANAAPGISVGQAGAAVRPGQMPTTTSAPARGAAPTPATGITSSTSSGPGGAAGGIMGVTSKSKDKSIRLYNGRGHYNEWAFVYIPQVQTPAAGAVPGTNTPGPGRSSLPDLRRGGRGRGGPSDGRSAPPPGGGRGFTPGFGTPRGPGR